MKRLSVEVTDRELAVIVFALQNLTTALHVTDATERVATSVATRLVDLCPAARQ